MKLKNILFPVDFSDRSRAAAPFIQSMARRYNATVTLLHVIPPLPPLYFDMGAVYPDMMDSNPVAANVDARLREFAAEQFPRTETRCQVSWGEPANVIVDYAQETGADLIALPTHGYGLFRRALLGSVTAKVLHDSSIPVWTSAHACEPSHRAHPQPRMIIAAVDLKEETEKTLQTALALARDAGATVEILHLAAEGYQSTAEPARKVTAAVAAAATAGALMVERKPVQEETELTAHGEGVVGALKQLAMLKKADLVVIGRGRVHGHLLARMNAHSYPVICESPCPVLSV